MALSTARNPGEQRYNANGPSDLLFRDSAYFAWPPRLWGSDGSEFEAVPIASTSRHAPALSADDIERATKGRLTKLQGKTKRPGKDALPSGDRSLKLGPWRSVASRQSDVASAREYLPIGWDVPRSSVTPSLSQPVPGRQYRTHTPALQSPDAQPELPSCPSPLSQRPISGEMRLAAQLAAYQSFIRGGDGTWVWEYYQSLPSRIGHEPCLDQTCRAYLAAAQCRAGKGGMTLRTCYAALAKSIDSLQIALREHQQPEGVRDTIIQSIALLAALEVTKGEHNLLNASHLEGIVSSLASRAKGDPTDVSRSLLSYFSCEAMTHSMVKGAASPLEALGAAHYQPIGPGSPSDPIHKLNTVRIELSVRLPRLIALTRAVRLADSGANKPAASKLAVSMLFENALALAEELYHVRDDAAERALRTDIECPGTAFFRKRHFTFSSSVEWEASSMYWHVRFIVLRLCLVLLASPRAGITDLADIYPNFECYMYQGKSVFSPATLEIEAIRLGQCLLASENIDKHNRPRRHRLRAQSFIILWGALKDLPQIDIEHEPGPNAVDRCLTLRDRMLEYTVRALRAPQLFFTEADMDEAAEMFIGGPIRGSYARLYGWKRNWGG